MDAVEYGGSGKGCPVLVVGRSREDIRVFGVDRGMFQGPVWGIQGRIGCVIRRIWSDPATDRGIQS